MGIFSGAHSHSEMNGREGEGKERQKNYGGGVQKKDQT